MKIDIFAYTSVGGRELNEDFVGYVYTEDGAVMALADGLGGVSGGEIASRAVVDTIIDEPYDSDDDAQWLRERILSADRRVKDAQHRLRNRMRSTAAALRISGERAVWAHTGDSRVYYLHGGEIARVTADHSLAFARYLAGELRRDEIASAEDQNVLTGSVGGDAEPRIDVDSIGIVPGDGFLMCSDGLWENLRDGEIAIDYLKADSAERWAELLLLRAVDRLPRHGDNLSLITAIINA